MEMGGECWEDERSSHTGFAECAARFRRCGQSRIAVIYSVSPMGPSPLDAPGLRCSARTAVIECQLMLQFARRYGAVSGLKVRRKWLFASETYQRIYEYQQAQMLACPSWTEGG